MLPSYVSELTDLYQPSRSLRSVLIRITYLFANYYPASHSQLSSPHELSVFTHRLLETHYLFVNWETSTR